MCWEGNTPWNTRVPNTALFKRGCYCVEIAVIRQVFYTGLYVIWGFSEYSRFSVSGLITAPEGKLLTWLLQVWNVLGLHSSFKFPSSKITNLTAWVLRMNLFQGKMCEKRPSTGRIATWQNLPTSWEENKLAYSKVLGYLGGSIALVYSI